MAQIYPSIPLSVALPKPPDLLGEVSKAQEIRANEQSYQQNQLKIQQEKETTEALKGADFSTPEGRNQTLVQLMQKAPQAGLALMKQFSELDKNKAQAQEFVSKSKLDDLKVAQGKQQALASAALPVWQAYQKALADGKPDQIARAEADKLMPQAISAVQESGVYSPDEIASLPRTFDPIKVGGALMSTGIYGKMVGDRLKEAQATEAESRTKKIVEETEHPEKFHPGRETGAQIFLGDDGKTYSVNPNKPDEGVKEIKTPEGVKLKKPGTGGTSGGGSRVQARIGLVRSAITNANARLDDIEKKFGDDFSVSPIFGEHPSGVMGKLGQAAYRKIGMSTKQQQFDADAGSFIDEAIPAFTGGLRGSDAFRRFLIGQLPQPGEDPETRKEKWALFRKNLGGIDNTYRQMFASNPQYWGGKTDGHGEVTPADIQQMQQDLSQGKSSGHQQAPQQALDYLKANPQLKDAFKQKYGYLPEGM